MLRGGYQDALLHQAGGIADAGYVAAVGLNLEAFQIGPAKHYSRAGRGGKYLQTDRRTAVQPDATASHG
jgi:hypothetical protein